VIPVNVKSPTGLVYRVQVGAFAKPVPQNLFKEFNPVTGETVNTGITRYLAGYFNNSASVLDAKKQIQALGYKDAFAIAYCDGKRISLAEAKRLEALKLCLPKGGNELNMEVALNLAESTGALDSTVLSNETNIATMIDQAAAPDELKAEPIEDHKGLFYTVQVGAFSKASSARVIENIEPLYSLRLPTGQTRYSAGMFNSIDEARPKKIECVEKGVKDAFITAYYNGQRITLAEADKLLLDKGRSVLELESGKGVTQQTTTATVTAQPKATSTPNQTGTTAVTTTSLPVDMDMPNIVIEEEKDVTLYQFVSRSTYETYPRDILNRYNNRGSYYYDENDKRVKSTIYTDIEDLPQVHYFKNEVDTVRRVLKAKETISCVEVVLPSSHIPGDLADWLIRYHHRKEYVRNESQVTIQLFDIAVDQREKLMSQLSQFGLIGKEIQVPVNVLKQD